MAGIDSYTKLILHGDESPLVDSSLTPKALTLLGGVARSAVESKFDGYAAYFDGGNDKIQVADSDDWYPALGEWSVDFWIKWSTIPTSNWNDIFSQITAEGTNNGGMQFGSMPSGGYLLNFTYFPDGTNYVTVPTSGFSWTTDWTHLAVGRDNVANQIKIFVDGTLRGSQAIAAETTFYNSNQNFVVGGRNGTAVHNIHGYMDDFNFVKANCLYRSDFTPPTSAYSAESFHIKGISSDAARFIVLNESDWSIDSNTEESSGVYDIEVTDTNKKLIIARKADGESVGFGDVTPHTEN